MYIHVVLFSMLVPTARVVFHAAIGMDTRPHPLPGEADSAHAGGGGCGSYRC